MGEAVGSDEEDRAVGEGENVGTEVGVVEFRGLEEGNMEDVEEGIDVGVVELVGGELGQRKGKIVAGLRYPRNIRIMINETPAAAAVNIQRVIDHSDKRNSNPFNQYRIS